LKSLAALSANHKEALPSSRTAPIALRARDLPTVSSYRVYLP
jgi:hypothetical protein